MIDVEILEFRLSVVYDWFFKRIIAIMTWQVKLHNPMKPNRPLPHSIPNHVGLFT